MAVPNSGNFDSRQYGKVNTSFSGADIVATIKPFNGKPRVFAEIQTLSYSIYRPTFPVFGLGSINAKGITRGQRSIAGTLIFTVFDRHVLKSVIDTYNDTTTQTANSAYKFTEDELIYMKQQMKTDEMPPFDINISFLNEYGNAATMNLYGVHIINEGQTMSIEDMITENTMQYMAMDIDLMDYIRTETGYNSRR